MIAVTAEAEVGPAARCASAIVFERARIATWRPRLRSPEAVAGREAELAAGAGAAAGEQGGESRIGDGRRERAHRPRVERPRPPRDSPCFSGW